MDNVTFIDITDPITSVVKTYAIIDRGNGEFTSMLKSTYEAMQANSTLPSNSSTPQAGA
jgi:hypothetical protein